MDSTTSVMFYLLVALILFIVGYVIYRKNFKRLKPPSVCLVTGGVKTGKSLLSVKLAVKDYRSRHRKWWFATKVLGKRLEEPLLYTNVSMSFGDLRDYDNPRKKPHRLDKNIVKITTDHLNRDIRFNYKSVIYIQEASLMADNMDFNNKVRNIDLSLYAKLICHETRGGVLYVDTQSVLDLHYAFKRVASTYYFIEKNLNLLLFHVLWVREMINDENGVNSFVDDVETTTRKVLIPFWYHHKYDRYEYSYLTDELGKCNDKFQRRTGIVSFNPMYISRSWKRKEVNKDERK